MKGIQNIETNRAFTLEELEQFMNDHYSRKGQFWHENRDIPPKNPDLERTWSAIASQLLFPRYKTPGQIFTHEQRTQRVRTIPRDISEFVSESSFKRLLFRRLHSTPS